MWYDHGILWIPLYKEEQYSEKKMGLKDPWPYHKRWYNEKLRENDEEVILSVSSSIIVFFFTVLKWDVRRPVCLWIPFILSYRGRRKRWYAKINGRTSSVLNMEKRWIALYRRHAITKSCHVLFYSVKSPWFFLLWICAIIKSYYCTAVVSFKPYLIIIRNQILKQ